jgi:hypothetical protein
MGSVVPAVNIEDSTSETPVRLDDPALLELIVGRTTASPERSRAIHLLGITPCTHLTMIAVLGPTEAVAELEKTLRAAALRPRRTVIGSLHAMALLGDLPADLAIPDGVRVGVGATGFAVDAATSWEKAVRAVRYASPTVAGSTVGACPVVRVSELGPFELLAERLRSSDIADVTDVDVLDGFAAQRGGSDVLEALEAITRAGSLREAARQMYLHHNSVAARLARAEQRLGYRVTEPAGTARLHLALALRRLRDTDLLA